MSIATPNGFQLDNSGTRVVVDPITRIEGHLRIEVNVDENNVIRNAVSTGTMWRGLEVILRGRDPRDAWAFVQRICGVCTGVHALASVRSRRARARHRDPRERQHDPQHHAPDPVLAGSPGALLPPARPRLGGRGQRAERGPGGNLAARAVDLELADVLARLLPRPAEPAEEVRRVGTARPLPQRVLGPPGVQAAARSQPDGGGALPRGARLPEGDRQDPDDLRRPQPAPELAGGRRPLAHQPERHGRGRRGEHGTVEHGRQDHRPHHRVHRQRLHPRPACDRLVLQGLGEHRRRPVVEVPDVLRRPAAVRERLQPGQPDDAARRDHRRQPERGPRHRPRQARRDPGVRTHSWYKYGDEQAGLHPFQGETVPNFDIGNAKGTRTKIEAVDEARSTRGSRRRAGTATRWKWARWHATSSAT